MRCAVISTRTGRVENLIVASESDLVEAGYLLKANPPEFVAIGAQWNGAAFIDPSNNMTSPAPIDGLETL